MSEIVTTWPHNFDLTTRPYQGQIFFDKRRNKVLVIHRRAGKTSLALNKLLYDATLPENYGKVYYYVCPTQRQAKDIVWKAPDMLQKYLPDYVVEKRNEVELTIYLKKGIVKGVKGGKDLPCGGSQIYIKGADDPDSLRGTNPYGVVLDEYAQMRPEVYNEIFRPVLAANGGWIWFMGTPKGKDDFYAKYNYAKEHPKQWQSYLLKASQSNVIPAENLAEAKNEMHEKAFSQEFECEFLEGTGIIFRRIGENVYGQFEEPSQSKQYKMGVDLARLHDYTVLTVIDRHTHNVVYFDRFKEIDWQFQKARIEALARRYNNCPITIDATGIGDAISGDLRRLGLQIQDIRFTSQTKKDLIENLAVMIEQNRIRYPNILELIKELEDYTYALLPTGNIRYEAPAGAFDDCVISLALAVWQIGEPLPYFQQHKGYGFEMNLRGQGYKKMVFR